MVTIQLHTRDGERKGSEIAISELSDAMSASDSGWVDIRYPDEDVRAWLQNEMHFHHLAVDDCFAEPVSKAYVYDEHKFVTFAARDADHELDTEHLRAFLSGPWLVTVRDAELPGLADFRRRFHSSKSRKRADLGSDYLLYDLLDAVADDWYRLLDRFSDKLDELEDQVFDPSRKYPNLLEDLHELKGDLREISKSTTPLNEIVQRMLRPDEEFVSPETEDYFRDLGDLMRSLARRVENYNAGAASTRDTYISQYSMRLAEEQASVGEVMRTLTIIATIMLPLTLIAGVFGMNTDVLPFASGDGFWYIITAMGLFSGLMLLWFHGKGWIGSK